MQQTIDISDGALIYLFSDRLLPPYPLPAERFRVFNLVFDPEYFLGRICKVPCKDVYVDPGARASLLFGIAFWSLRERGVISLNLLEGRELFFFKYTYVQAQRLKEVSMPGLEGVIMQHLRKQPAVPVSKLIKHWYGGTVEMPSSNVVAVVVEEAVSAGYLFEPPRLEKKIRIRPYQTLPIEPDCSKLGALEDSANDLVARWERFQQDEPELHELLLKDCRSGIESCRESQSTL